MYRITSHWTGRKYQIRDLGCTPKWKRKHGTTANLQSRGFPPKLMDRQRRALISEATKCPIIILEELGKIHSSNGRIWTKSGLYGKVVRRKMWEIFIAVHRKTSRRHKTQIDWSKETKTLPITLKIPSPQWWQLQAGTGKLVIINSEMDPASCEPILPETGAEVQLSAGQWPSAYSQSGTGTV